MGYDKKTGHFTTRTVDGFSDCPIKIISSKRGPGKTFGMKRKIMKTPGTSVWLFRDTLDFKEAMSTWLDDLTLKVDDTDGSIYDVSRFTVDLKDASGMIYLDEQPKLYLRVVSMVNHIKHETFRDDVQMIVYDEAVPIKDKKLAGISSEAEALMDIIRTVRHDATKPIEGLKVYIFCNPRDFTHEIFRYFHIDATLGYGARRTMPGVVWEYLEPPQNMITDAFTGMADSVNSNLESWKDAAHFVGVPPSGLKLYGTVRDEGRWFTMCRDAQGYMWILHGSGRHADGALHFGSVEGLRGDEVNIERLKLRKTWLDAHQRGSLRYESLNVKSAFLETLRL